MDDAISAQFDIMREHIDNAWRALQHEGRDTSERNTRAFPVHSIEDWLQTIEADHRRLTQLLTSPEVVDR